MNKIRLIITSVISIVLVSMLLIGSTYSIFTSQDIDENLNVYKTGDLNIKYYSNGVKITDVTPMTTEEADAVIPHRITVTNNGNVAYQFDVILTDTTSSESNTIDYQYIMTKVGYLEPKKLSSCSNNIIKEDVILLPGKSVDIDVRIWLADNLSNSEMGKSFYAKLSIDGQAIINDNQDINNDILSLNYMKAATKYNATDYRSDTYRTYIKEASFVDYIDTTNASIDATTNEKIIWDKAANTSESNGVVAWLEDNGDLDENGNKYYNLYIGSMYKIYIKSCSWLFNKMTSLEKISFDNFDTSLTTDMGNMFNGCSSLTSLDVSNFDTSNVTSMGGMFSLSGLKKLNLSNFDTSNVTSMRAMFSRAYSLINIDVSNWDTSKVTNMEEMFYNCAFAELDLSDFDFSNVTSMYGMFSYCVNLTSLDLGDFNASKITSMYYMFQNCRSLISLDLSNFNMSNVTNLNQTFQNCSSLENLYLNNADFTNVKVYDYAFSGVPNNANIYVMDENQKNWIVEKYTNLINIIY